MEITTVTGFLDYYERIRARTLRVIAIVPPNQMEFCYKPGKFTIADIIRHIAAIERCMYAENVVGNPSRYNGCGKNLADGYDSVIQFFNLMHDESLSIFRSLKDHALKRKCKTPGGVEIPVWKWLRAMVEHEIHHRGQLYLYLNMLDIKTPPLFGLSAEEVQQRYLK